MATLESISEAIAALPTTITAAVVAALPPQSTVDTTAIETAITNGFAALTAELKNNVEGAAPVVAPTDTTAA